MHIPYLYLFYYRRISHLLVPPTLSNNKNALLSKRVLQDSDDQDVEDILVTFIYSISLCFIIVTTVSDFFVFDFCFVLVFLLLHFFLFYLFY